MSARRVWISLTAILVLGAAVRLVGIDFGLPHRLARPDESRIVREADRILRGQWIPTGYSYPPLFAQATAAVRWGAAHLPGGPRGADLFDAYPSFLAGRLLSVLAGTATLGLVGLAAAVKYPGALLAPAVVAAHLVAPRTPGRRRLTGLALCGGGCLVAFVLACPLVLVEPVRLVTDALGEARTKTGGAGVDLVGRGWVQHVLYSLRHGLGLPMLLAGVVGIFLLPRGRPRVGTVVVVLLVTAYGVLGAGHVVYPRYVLPLTPLLALTAALALDAAARLPTAPAPGPGAGAARAWLPVSLHLLVVSVSAWNVFQSDRLLAAEDTRLVAARVLHRTLAPGERVLIVARYARPARALCPGPRFVLRERPFLEERCADGPDPLRALAAEFDYLVLDDYYFPEPSRFAPSPATRARLGVPGDGSAPEDGRRGLELVQTISPLREGLELSDAHPVLRREDRLYLPYAGFAGFARPGPLLRIYRLPRE